LSGCALPLEFSQKQELLKSYLITADQMEKNQLSLGKCTDRELRQSNPLRTPLQPPHCTGTSRKMALRRGAPLEFLNNAGAICSAKNPSPEKNPVLECTRTDAIFKKYNVKTNFKLKINVIRKYTLNFRFIQQKCQPNLVRLSL
jgi:hypothetical protein